jgi:hypothetical protein
MTKSLKITKRVIISRKSKDIQCNSQTFEETKGVISSRKSKKDREHSGLMLEEPKGVISSRKSRKDREHKSAIKRTKYKQRYTKHDT